MIITFRTASSYSHGQAETIGEGRLSLNLNQIVSVQSSETDAVRVQCLGNSNYVIKNLGFVKNAQNQTYPVAHLLQDFIATTCNGCKFPSYGFEELNTLSGLIENLSDFGLSLFLRPQKSGAKTMDQVNLLTKNLPSDLRLPSV